MDSSVILKHAQARHDEVFPLTFDYGQRHNKEVKLAKSIATNTKLVRLSHIRDLTPTSALTADDIDVAQAKDVIGDAQVTANYVPFRNLQMISIALAYAEAVGADTVYHGAALIDSQAGFWDGSKEFLDKINDVTALNRKNRITVEAPLLSMSKAAIIRYGQELGVDFSETWTCYEGKDQACGYCTACSARIAGFLEAGVRDPISYSRTDIPWNNQ